MLNRRQSVKNYFTCFIYCGMISAVMLAIVTAFGKGAFLYAGDFNQQQIPFNYFSSKFLQSGGGTYSWATDIGSGFVNSYSFYTLGSPFFWLASLFPPDWMPYLMYPLLILKFAVMGGGVQLWAKRYFNNNTQVLMVAVLYMTSGYAVSNIFFNHFIDVMALFPYLLWALDLAMMDNKKGFFPVAVAFNFLVNYFFFFGEVVFLIIYLCGNLLAGRYRMTTKKFFSMAFESLLGCAMGGVLAFPAFVNLIGSPRAGTIINGWGFMTYKYTQQYLAIIMNAFFAPDRMFANDLWTTAKVQWTSMSAYIPGISLAGVLAYLCVRKGKKDAWKNIFLFSVIAALVPILNTSFTFLNSTYYARWYYMPLLIMCAMTIKGMEENADGTERYLRFILTAALITTLVFAITPLEKDGTWQLGLTDSVTSIGCVTVLTVLLSVKMLHSLHTWKKYDDLFWKKMLSAVVFCGVLFGGVHTFLTAQYSLNNYFMPVKENYKTLGNEMPVSDVDYRMDHYTIAVMNQGLWSGISNVKAFNSTVEPSLLSFYKNIGYDRGTRLEIGIDHPALYTFLNVKYHGQDLLEYQAGETMKDSLLQNEASYKKKPWGAEKAYLQMYKMPSIDYLDYIGLTAGSQIYENTLYAGMGFQYDTYISQESFDKLTQEQKEYMLLKSVLLSDEDIETYGDLFRGEIDTEELEYTLDQMKSDVQALKETSCSKFKTDNYGFSAEMDTDSETIAVFSIPFSKNWTITVNGEKADIVQVDGGMLGIHLPDGHCEIRGDYHTAFAKEAVCIAFAGWLVFAAYLVYIKTRKNNPAEDETAEDMDESEDDETMQNALDAVLNADAIVAAVKKQENADAQGDDDGHNNESQK